MALGWLRRWVEGEWTKRPALARFTADHAGARRLRLAGCASFHAVAPVVRLGHWHEFFAIGERLADATATEHDRHAARQFTAWASDPWREQTLLATGLTQLVAEPFDFQSLTRAVVAAGRIADSQFAYSTLAAITAAVLDVFGDPFDPVAFDPAWRTRHAVGVAAAVYDARAFGDLPVLADALQEAGCADERVLGHCRGGSTPPHSAGAGVRDHPGVHYRGCWVVDAVLDKLLPDGPPHVPRRRRT